MPTNRTSDQPVLLRPEGWARTALAEQSLSLVTVAPDFRSTLIVKRSVDGHPRAVSRNGRVMLVADRPWQEWERRRVMLSFRPWRRAILSRYDVEIWGVLVRVLALPSPRITSGFPWGRCVVRSEPCSTAMFNLELGGLHWLAVHLEPAKPASLSGLGAQAADRGRLHSADVPPDKRTGPHW